MSILLELVKLNNVESIKSLSQAQLSEISIFMPINDALFTAIDLIDPNQLEKEKLNTIFLSLLNYSSYNNSLPEDIEKNQLKFYQSFSNMLNRVNWENVDVMEFFRPLKEDMYLVIEALNASKNEAMLDRLSFHYFKYTMLNWEKLSFHQTVYFNNIEEKDRANFSEQLHYAIEKINTKTEIIEFLKEGQYVKLIEELKTKTCYEDIQKHQNVYSDSDMEASKIRFLDNLAFGLNEENFSKKLKNKIQILKIKEPRDLTPLLTLPQYLEFKSISFYKETNLTKIASFLLKSAESVTDIFGLESNSSIGHQKLALHFEPLSRAGTLAHYMPKTQSITINNSYIDSILAFFVHEYTHYLQDLVVNLGDEQYKKHVPNKFKLFSEWKKIDDILRQEQKPQIDNLISNFVAHYKPEKKEGEIFVVNNQDPNILTKLDFIEKNTKALFYGEINFKQLKNIFKENPMIDPTYQKVYLRDIKELFKAYQNTSFEKALWKSQDKLNNRFYFQKNFEIHARLVEQLVKSVAYYEVGEEKMVKIKPILKQFNHLIASLAKDSIENSQAINLSEKIKQHRTKVIHQIESQEKNSLNK